MSALGRSFAAGSGAAGLPGLEEELDSAGRREGSCCAERQNSSSSWLLEGSPSASRSRLLTSHQRIGIGLPGAEHRVAAAPVVVEERRQQRPDPRRSARGRDEDVVARLENRARLGRETFDGLGRKLEDEHAQDSP